LEVYGIVLIDDFVILDYDKILSSFQIYMYDENEDLIIIELLFNCKTRRKGDQERFIDMLGKNISCYFQYVLFKQSSIK
jgi:hypothetical protein